MCDWVHCNKCMKQYNPQSAFYVIECGHIFCHTCVETIQRTKKCVYCGRSGEVLLLSKDMDQDVLDFFSPPEALLIKGLEAYKYHLQQCDNLIKDLTAKNEYLKKQNQMLQSMLHSPGTNPQRFMTTTPCSQILKHNKILDNTSLLSSMPPRMESAPLKVHPGYAKRTHISSSGPSQGPSLAPQSVDVGHDKTHDDSMIQRSPTGIMRSLKELGRSKTQ